MRSAWKNIVLFPLGLLIGFISFKNEKTREETEKLPEVVRAVNRKPAVDPPRREVAEEPMTEDALASRKIVNLVDIIESTDNRDFRSVGIDALGQMPSEEAQSNLMKLYGNLEDTKLREKIIYYLKPQSLEDEKAKFLFQVLEDPQTADSLKENAALNISMALVGSERSIEEILEKMPASFHEKFETVYKSAFDRQDFFR